MSSASSSSTRSHVGVLIFEDVEVLDFCGPFEVFSVANALGESGDDTKLFDVHVIAETTAIVSAGTGFASSRIFHRRASTAGYCARGRGTRRGAPIPESWHGWRSRTARRS